MNKVQTVRALVYSALNGMSVLHSCPQDSGIYADEEIEELLESEVVNDFKETAVPRHKQGKCTYRLPKTELGF